MVDMVSYSRHSISSLLECYIELEYNHEHQMFHWKGLNDHERVSDWSFNLRKLTPFEVEIQYSRDDDSDMTISVTIQYINRNGMFIPHGYDPTEPAILIENSTQKIQVFMCEGVPEVSSPAVIWFHKDYLLEMWFCHQNVDRWDGPAISYEYKNNGVESEALGFVQNGKLLRWERDGTTILALHPRDWTCDQSDSTVRLCTEETFNKWKDEAGIEHSGDQYREENFGSRIDFLLFVTEFTKSLAKW